jgi:predicted Zn-dependent protease
VNFYSFDREITIGQLGAEDFTGTATVLRGPQVNEYLNALGHKLSAATASYHQFPYTFAVIRPGTPPPPMAFPSNSKDPAVIEAIALPGGPIFVPAELVDKLDNESQLAAVLAHAIAHIALRHSTRKASRGEIANLSNQNMPPDLKNVGAMQISMGFLAFDRAFENEADKLAVHILTQTGYDPAAFTAYLRKLPAVGNPMYSALPDPQSRIRTVEAAIQSLPAATYAPESAQFADWKKAVSAVATQ